MNYDLFCSKETFAKAFETENLDERVWSVEMVFQGVRYRLTTEQTLDDEKTKELREKLQKPNGVIELYRVPPRTKSSCPVIQENMFIGLYDDVEDLFSTCFINNVPIVEIIFGGLADYLEVV